jgi:uncharacterized lipoprotein YmbA
MLLTLLRILFLSQILSTVFLLFNFKTMNAKNPRVDLTNSAGAPRLRLRFLPAWALMAVTAAMVGGCQLLPPSAVDTTRFFVLTASMATAGAPDAGAKPEAQFQIGLRQVELPAYLRATKSMVVRDGANEIRYQDYSRWAEPLDAGINRVLMERLSASPNVLGVDAHPLRGDLTRNCYVAIRVVHCEGVAGENPSARFSATYEITTPDGSSPALNKTYNAPDAKWDGKDFNALAKLLSDAVSGLGFQIAADLPK